MINPKWADTIIPGYSLLPETKRSWFEGTPAGEQLAKFESQNFIFWPFNDSRENLISRLKANSDYKKLIVLRHYINKRVKQLHPHLNSACQNPYIDLSNFNLNQAQRLASEGDISALNDSHLDAYKRALLNHLKESIGLINGKDLLKEKIELKEERSYLESLSVMLANAIPDKEKEFFNRVADTHGFIQATGFSTQNETSYLALLDIYNYGRSSETIAETRLTLSRFLQPFTPLLTEYRDITHHEHNVLLQLFRTLMPMLIISAVVIFVSALLSPFLVPELAFIIILIPTVYIGLAVATSYVVAKDSVYHTARHMWYGGQFNIPEYKVSERMIDSFKSEDNASKVRNFYVDEINLCFEKEKQYLKATPGTLTDEMLKDRKENAVRTGTLQLEWYDIHSNDKLGCDKTPLIVSNRLLLDIKKECELLKKKLPELLKKEILESVNEVIHEIKTSIEAGTNESLPAINNGQHRFFMPENKVKAEELYKFRESIKLNFGHV